MNGKEHLARQMCRAAHDPLFTGECGDCYHGECECWPDWMPHAEMTLFQIREPRADQLEAGQRALANLTWMTNGRPKHRDLKTMAMECWRAMADELRGAN